MIDATLTDATDAAARALDNARAALAAIHAGRARLTAARAALDASRTEYDAAEEALFTAYAAAHDAERALTLAHLAERAAGRDRPRAVRHHRCGPRYVRDCGERGKRYHKRETTRRERHEARALERAARANPSAV